MKELKNRIIKEGKALPGSIIKVDGFLNHKIDSTFMEKISDEFAKLFDLSKVNLILTAEASGIPIATVCSLKWKIPMVFAKKAKSDNIESGLFMSEIASYTYKKKTTLIVSKEWLGPKNHVLIIDDFMAKGQACKGLVDIVQQSGATLEGIGICVEKGFQGGGDYFREKGYNFHSLATIKSAKNGNIIFR